MSRKFFFALVALGLGGCYTPNQITFESFVRERISEGMATSESISRLKTDGFDCNNETVFLQRAPGSVACVRQKDNMFPPYACLERIEFLSTSEESRVSKITIGKVTCAGL